MGRAKEATTVKNKPIEHGFKVWVVAQKGFFLRWIWHEKGNGPVGVKAPLELGGSKTGKGNGGNKTQSVVLYLLLLLPLRRYIVYLDNLFTSRKLYNLLRDNGYGATGTARTDSGILKRFVDMKKKEDKADNILWGQLFKAPFDDGKVMCFAWKDNALALFISNCNDGKRLVFTPRKRPSKTSSSAKTARAVFGNEARKILPVPEFNKFYNMLMGAIDEGDQLRSYNTGARRCRRGGWQSVFTFLFDVVLVNTYLLSYHQDVPKSDKFTDQLGFRKALYTTLFEAGKGAPRMRKRAISQADFTERSRPILLHQKHHRGKQGDCVSCKGDTINTIRPLSDEILVISYQIYSAIAPGKRQSMGVYSATSRSAKKAIAGKNFTVYK
jgi:hypothetical protein